MREKTMKKGHLLLTLLAFVCLMGLGTIHANAATVKAKVDVKKFYGIAEQVLQEINKERRSNGLQDLKMDATLTEAAMNIALQEQGGNATVSNPEIYNDKYTIKGAFKLGDIDGYDEYEDNLWKETTKGKRAITKHVSELGKFLYKDSNISSTIGIGIVATDNPKNIPVTGAKRFLCKLSNDGASWSSSNPSIVSVDANGNITAKKNGIATVTVRVGSLQATKKYVVSDIISVDTDTLLSLPNWKSKSDIPKEYTGNCYAGGYALEVKNGRITWSKNMKTNKVTRPGKKKSVTKVKKIKGNYYKIISKSKKTVQYVKPVKKNIISVTIPSSIKLNGKRYKVTGIAANAFKNCKKLKKVTIGTNVNSIGKRTFYGCSKLRTIKVKTSKLTGSRVGKQAFKGLNKKAVIKVPKKQLKAYKRLFRAKGVGKKVTIKK